MFLIEKNFWVAWGHRRVPKVATWFQRSICGCGPQKFGNHCRRLCLIVPVGRGGVGWGRGVAVVTRRASVLLMKFNPDLELVSVGSGSGRADPDRTGRVPEQPEQPEADLAWTWRIQGSINQPCFALCSTRRQWPSSPCPAARPRHAAPRRATPRHATPRPAPP